MHKRVSLMIPRYNENRLGSYRALFLEQKAEAECGFKEIEGESLKILQASDKVEPGQGTISCMRVYASYPPISTYDTTSPIYLGL